MAKTILALVLLMTFVAGVHAMGSAPQPPSVTLLQEQVQAELTRMDLLMQQAATKLAATDLRGPEACKILSDVFNAVDSAIVVSTVSLDGILLAVEPSARYPSGVGQSIKDQPHFPIMQKTGKPILSGMFKAVEGFNAVALGYPVVSQPDGKSIGYTTLVFQPDALIRKIVNNQAGTVTFEALAIQRDGKVIYDRDVLQVGKMTFSDPGYTAFPSLIAFARQVVSVPQGSGSYQYLNKDRATTVTKQATWATVGLYGTEWRLIVSANQ